LLSLDSGTALGFLPSALCFGGTPVGFTQLPVVLVGFGVAIVLRRGLVAAVVLLSGNLFAIFS